MEIERIIDVARHGWQGTYVRREWGLDVWTRSWPLKKKNNTAHHRPNIYFYRRNAFSNEMTAKITKDNISYGILTISIVLQYSAISQTNRRKKNFFDDFWLNDFQLISHPLSWITTWNLSMWIKKHKPNLTKFKSKVTTSHNGHSTWIA